MISVGLLASLTTSNTAIAFIFGALFNSILVFGHSMLGTLSETLGKVVEPLGVVNRFGDFARGVVSVPGIVYFLSVIAVMLYANTLIVDRRHWPKLLEGRRTWTHHACRVAGAILIVISVNTMLARTSLRLDVTSEGLHSLSAETRQILNQLPDDRPVFVQAFISPDVPEPYVQARVNLLSTLDEIGAVSGGKVEVLVEDTVPFSSQARDAREKFGIMPRQIPDLENARAGFTDVFLGVAITCGASEQVIPFIDRGLSPEYEVARGIRVVTDAKRKRIGVLQTAINLFGGLDFQSMRSTPAWPVVDELKKQYEVVRLQPGGGIPDDLDGLLVVLPSSLPQQEMDSLSDAVLKGIPTLLLVDPLPVINIGLSPSEEPGGPQNPFMRNQQAPQTPKGDVAAFLAKLGVAWDSKRVVWDSYNPHPDLAHLPPEVVFVGEGNENPTAFSRDELATRALQELVLLYPGELQKAVDSKLDFIPLVESGKSSGDFQYAQLVQRSFFGTQLNQSLPHNPAGTDYVFAAEVKGTASPGEVSTPGDSGEAEKAETKSSRPVHLIVVADVDFISDQFFQIRARGPQNLNFDNVTFFLNCIDVLAGDDSFIALRGKRVRHRTLERVEARTKSFLDQRVAEEQQAEKEADAALADAQKRLDERVDEIQQRPDLDARTKQIMARNLQESESRKFEVLKANIEAEKAAKIHASREDTEEQIRGIQNGIRTYAVLLPPIPVFLIGVWIFFRRQQREREAASAARRLRA
jgi:ABC-2 type transport system permease protein